jgi:aspartyl-tRNA(Asn)/glutamyl-tRNA(Gln) amidotransferase subunit A
VPDDPLNVFITRLDAAGSRRCGVKDLFDTAGIRTTYGSRIFSDHVPDRDATAWVRLREAGWTMAGKTNLHEFAYGTSSANPWYGPVRNPSDPDRVAGGSSGGSAAGIVTGDFELGLGSDTGGSIRIPASFCGVVGFKPTYGAIPLDGCWPLIPWLDHAGPIAADVGLCAAAHAVMAGVPEAAPRAADSLTIGTAADLSHVDPGVAEAYLAAIGRLRETGVRVVERDLPPMPPSLLKLRLAAATYTHRGLFPARRDEYDPSVARKLDRGLEPFSYFESLEVKEEESAWKATCAGLVADIDLLAMPTIPVPPPLIASDEYQVRGDVLRHTQPFNHLGWPAISVPCGRDALGLPVGLQLAGPGDDVVLGGALTLEAAIRG